MSRKWTLPTLMLFLCSGGALQANPLDSPGVVYIDGLPCNRACQSYMAASDRALSARHREKRGTIVVVPAEVEIEGVEHAPRPRVARHPAPVSRTMPRAGIAASSAKTLNTKAPNTKKAAARNLAAQTTPEKIPGATATMTPEKPVEKTVAGGEVPERKLQNADRVEPGQRSPNPATPPPEAEITVPPATLEVAALPAVAAAPASTLRTLQEQVAEATGLADRLTAITLGREAAGKSDNQGIERGEASDTDTTASVPPINPDNLVALVLARPEINSLSDFNNKSIAIEKTQSAASGSVGAALMAAGAAEVQFSEGLAGPIDRLISGEVPAAVLTLASREAAEWFPDIAGFRIFRVPLSSQRARL